MYAQGNNLGTATSINAEPIQGNCAPNVSDVVWLIAGDMVKIYVWQSADIISIPIVPGMEKTYVSIHKVS